MSRLIKSSNAVTSRTDEKVIGIRPVLKEVDQEDTNQEEVDLSAHLLQMKEEAETIVKQANEEAMNLVAVAQQNVVEMEKDIQQMRADWDNEKQQLIEVAQQEGYSQGFNEGYEAGYHEYLSFINHAKDIVALAEKDYEKHIQKADQTLLHLAVRVAESILKTTLADNQDHYLEIVREVVKKAREHKDVSIHVPPEHYHLVLSHKDELQSLFSQPTQMVYVYPNEQLGGSDCLIESSFGRIDASVDTQLEEIKTKLMQLLLEDEDHE